MADDALSYSDLIQPDNAIERAIIELESLGSSYKALTDQVKRNAEEIRRALTTASGATAAGRKQIDEAVAAANLLYEAYKKLKEQQQTVAKTEEYFSEKMRETKKGMQDSYKEANAAAGSYNKLKLQLQETLDLYKSLSTAERIDPAFGGKLLQDAINYKQQLQEIENEMKLVKEAAATPVTHASGSYDQLKQELKELKDKWAAMSESERDASLVGDFTRQQIIETTAKLKELEATLKTTVTDQDKLNDAKQKYNQLLAQTASVIPDESAELNNITDVTQALDAYNQKIKERERIVKLQNTINTSAEGSYNKLAAQYELNKIKLNAMSAEMRNGTAEGKALEEETKRIYDQMKQLQEATGNYRLSVGEYAIAWNGLSNAVNQIVRELPSLAINFNTFFLAISNNIPILVDEIQKVRHENKALLAQGKPTKSVVKEITSALLSWQTALIVLLTVLSKYGDEIVDFVDYTINGVDATVKQKDTLNDMNAELEKTSNGYGKTLAKYKELQRQWSKLDGLQEQNKWIKTNAEAFKEFDINCTGAKDAEIIFAENSDLMIKALTLRAKAAAAASAAQKKYQDSLAESMKGGYNPNIADIGGWIDRFHAIGRAIPYYFGFSKPDTEKIVNDYLEEWKRENANATEQQIAEQKKTLERQFSIDPQLAWGNAMMYGRITGPIAYHRAKSQRAQAEGEALQELEASFQEELDELLESLGLTRFRKKDRDRTPRDLTDTINKNYITAQKKYEESITKLTNGEFAKRRKAAEDQVQDENNRLREMLRKNEEYVNNVEGKYKELTAYQKMQIEQQNQWINATIQNNLDLLAKQLQQIQKEQQVNSLKLRRETINAGFVGQNIEAPASNEALATTGFNITQSAKSIESSLVRERQLLTESLELEYELTLATNKKLREEGDKQARSDEEILIEHNKKKLELWSRYDNAILTLRQQNTDDQLELVKKGSKEELDLLLQKNEIARQLALAENAAKPASEQVSSTTINAKFNKALQQTRGTFEMTRFTQQQEVEAARFSTVKHSETQISKFKLQQEKERWLKQIELAKSGALDWSDAQIKAAELTVLGIERELSELNNFFANLSKKGLGGTLLDMLGFNDEAIDALCEAANIVIEQFEAILDAEVELAEKSVEMAEKRVEAAQKAYDAEVEARNNGYANNVATTKKELEAEKKKQQEKQKILEAAQRRQEALQSIMQTSSLITASANLWSAFSSVGPIGPALAIAAIASMWTSFAAAKIKAKQVTAIADEYGDGGLEFLEGGSHASGNDIDLHTKNKRKRNMRAEGGEALAIINKRQTRKYKKALPGIIESLNKGIFEDKYINAFNGADNANAFIVNNPSNLDLSKLEKDVSDIRKQNNTKYYVMPNGDIVIVQGNVKRIIKK